MKCLTCLCLVGVLFASSASAAPLYNIVPVGIAEYTSNIPIGLTEAGQVVGHAGNNTRVWLYNGATTIEIGFTGPEHTSSNGYKNSISSQFNEAGQVTGSSYRYNGGSTYLGLSAWLYNGTTTIQLGFTGPEYTTSGYKYSGVYGLNEAGLVTGFSVRYGVNTGSIAWLYDGTTTIELGLSGSDYTRYDGSKSSSASAPNEAGQVAGSSERYGGGGGRSAWVYNGSNTIDIGLTGPEHTRGDGYKVSSLGLANSINEAGQVSGVSYRYNGGGTQLGQSAWFYNGATTTEIGLTGSEYTRSDGTTYSFTGAGWGQLNQTGQVTGYSRRYNGGNADLGQTAWLYNGTNTIKIGLTGPEHTRNDGYKYSRFFLNPGNGINEAGQISGSSYRFNGGGTQLGQSIWLYNGATTIDVGLTAPEHTRSDGYKYSAAILNGALNEAGQVIGYSERYNGGSTELGRSAWLYDGATTIDLGLTGPEHTRADGYKYSEALRLNEAGQVIGYSDRYNGGVSNVFGRDAWLYDPALDQTISLRFSTRSDGYAATSASYLGEDGLVLGAYTLFDALDTNLGNRAFSFTIEGGMRDLGFFVDGGLAANGWDYLASANRANGAGQIIGYGKLTSQSGGSMAYLLTPAVPEPSMLALVAAGVLGLVGCAPRRPGIAPINRIAESRRHEEHDGRMDFFVFFVPSWFNFLLDSVRQDTPTSHSMISA